MANQELIKLITTADNWTCGEVDEDIPTLYRFRPQLQAFIDNGKYIHKLLIRWPYEPDTASELPSDEDMDLMADVEDALIEALEEDALAVMTAVITGSSIRRMIWYTANLEETGKRINEALSDFDQLPLELISSEEPDWAEYLHIINEHEEGFTEYDENSEN